MEHKNKSFSRMKRHQSDKVLRYSIRKYSFGAASVAVAALMFLGTHAVSADVIDDKNQSVIGAPNPNEEESPLVVPGKTEKIEETKETEKVEVAKESEKREEPVKNPEAVETNSLNNGTSTSAITATKDAGADKVAEKQTLDKSQLQASITNVQELLDKVNKEKAPASTLAAIQADLEAANSVLNNNSLGLTQAEVDAAAKTLSDKLFILSSMSKIGTPEKVVKEGENTIANTGSRDSRNGETMEEGSDLRSAPIDKNTKRGELGIVVANSGFITGYATPSSTIEIKRNGTTVLTSTLDDTGAFKLNASGIEVGDVVELVVNGQTVTTTTVKQTDTVAFNDSLAGIAQVDGYTAAEADVEVTVGGKTYTTRSQSNGYFTVNVDTKLMVKDAVVTTVIKKNGKEVGSGTSTVRDTKVTDFGVGWIKNPMINYSERDVYSPDTKQYAFVSVGTADKAYDNIRVYREERIEKDGNKYYYWILDSGPAANAQAGLSKKVSLTIPRSVGDPYDFTYTKYADGVQYSHNEYPNATAWEHENSNYRAYVKNGERRSGTSYTENLGSWMDYANPDNNWWRNIYRDSRKDGTDRNPDAASRVKDMYGITTGGLIYNLGRGVIEDKLNVKKGQRTIITFKTKILEGDELDQSIMSDWGNKDKNNPMLADIKKRLANDPYLAYGGYTDLGYVRYRNGQNAIIGTLPLKPEEAERYNIKPRAKEQSTKVGVIPDAYNSIANPNELPAGTTYRWFKDPDVSRPTAPNAPVYGKVEVIIPERGTSIVDAPIHVTEDKAKTPEAPSATAKEDGSVTAKPQDSTKVDKIKVSYTGEDGSNKTAEGNKGGNGTWTVTGNPDVQIDASTGEITIPADKVKDNTEVTAVTTNGNSDESAPAKATAKAPKPEKPILTAPNTGDVTAKPQDSAKADKITVTYKDEDGTNVTVVGNKGNDNTWTIENNPGVTIDANTGAITIPADKVRDNTVVTAITKNGNSVDSDPASETAKAPKPATPTVVAKEDGSVTAKPQDPEKADKITVTYTGEDDSPKTVVGTKDKFGQWTSDDTEIKINADTGEITIPAEKVKNETVVKAITKNGTSDDSDPATDKAKTPDNEPPILTLSANNLKVVEGETITFRVKAKDDKNVTFEATEFLAKYFKRYNVGTTGVVSSRYVKNTEKEKEIEITINTIAEDVGKQNTIIFNATDDAGNKATPVIFSFDVTPRDRTAPTISANGATVTNREEIIPIPVTATDNDGGVGMRENTPIEVKDLPDGLKFENNQIVGTPTGASGVTKVTITAYDKNDNKAEKTIEIVVKGQNDKYNPVGINRTVPKNSTPNAEDSIGNKQDLPQGTKYHWLTPPDTSQGGQTVSAVVVVEYPDKTTDNVSVNISVPTNLTAEVTKPNEVLEKRAVDSKKVVTPNKEGSTIATPDEVNGLTVNGEGKLTGTPKVENWGKDEEKRAITIPVKVTNGNEEITVSVPVTILRDTDGDGEPDTTDPDDDGDKITDEEEKAKGTDPKIFDKPDKPTSYGLTGAVKPSTVTENKQVTEPGVVTPNKTGSTIETPASVNGLTVDNNGSLTGTPKVDSWGEGEEERDITIPVKVKKDSEEANVSVPVKIQRDTDGDGNPDVTDTDDDNDGISDDDEKRNGTDPKVANGLTGIVTAPAKVKEKTPVPTTLPKVVTPNKEGSTITTENPVNELKVNGEGKLEGTPTVNDWVGGEEERNITIPVKITREKEGTPKEEVTVHVPVTIQRDTDNDGTPDVDDLDDDNDGISDEDEKNNGTDSKTADGLSVKVTKPNVVLEKKEVTPKEVVTPNKKDATITTTTPEVNGLTVNGEGKLTGTPTVDNWGDDEEKTINIPVTVTRKKDGKENVIETVAVKVPVTIQRDTDGDGTPDVLDTDDDNDGIPDEVEKSNGTNPKVPDNLTAIVASPTKVKEKKPVTPTKVVTPNMPNSAITTENPMNGLKVNNEGNLEGTPSVDNWKKDEEERHILIPVKVKNGDKEIIVKVPVTIQRDTDNDGIPDSEDTDDDNDGIPDTVEDTNGTDPKAANDLEVAVTNPDKVKEKQPVTPIKVVTPNKEGSTIVTNAPNGTVNGLKVNDKGELEGIPTVNDWDKEEEERPIDIPVKVTKVVEKFTENGKEEVTEEKDVTVRVTIQRDTDGDGDPDVTDTDDDNDGIPDEVEKANGTDPKNANNLTAKVSDPTKVTEKKPVPSTLAKVVTPNKDGSTITTENPVNGLSVDKDGKLTGTPSVTNWGSDEERKINIPVKVKNGDEEIRVEVPVIIQRDTDGDGDPDVTDKDDDNDGISDEEEKKNGTDPKVATTQTPVEITITREKNGDAIVTPKKPDGKPYPKDTKVEIPGENGTTIVVTIGEEGFGTVPNDQLPKTEVPGQGVVTEPNKEPSKPVDVTTPARKTPTVELTQNPSTGDVTVTPKKIDGSNYPTGTTVTIPGKDGKTIDVVIGENGSGTVANGDLPERDVPGTAIITEPNQKPSEPVDITTPAKKVPTLQLDQDPKTGDVTVTPKKPDGTTYPSGTKVEIPGKNGNPITVTIGKDGTGKVPNNDLPETDTPGTGKIKEDGKAEVEIKVETPKKIDPTAPETAELGTIEITRKPNGDAVVTPKTTDGKNYPKDTKVKIPGENGTSIVVTIGENGSGEVPNDQLPKYEVPGKGTVTEPNKKPSQPVAVTTPARKKPTVEMGQNPNTGDVTVTPKKPDGTLYPENTKVEIPGKDGKTIEVTLDKDGKGTVPNNDLPDEDTPGIGKIKEDGKPEIDVKVETPKKINPNHPATEQPTEIDITRKPNGDAIVTPKKPDGTPYQAGTTVKIPGENGTPIVVTIGKDGFGLVPNDKLPKDEVPGKGIVTEPGARPSQPVDVITPARKPSTIRLDQDPKTGDVTVIPMKPGGGTYPPGTKVEIPGKNGNPIVVEIGQGGTGTVPNNDLPDGNVPGTGKITEPGKPTTEAQVLTPGKINPIAPQTDQSGKIEITRNPNGDAVVTPKKPDGSTYPSGTKVVIPGENGTSIIVTIGDNGSGTVPNDKLPKEAVTGKGIVTEPNKKPSQPVAVTTPARKTPTVELTQDPATGNVTVTPKKPDGTTYPPGTTVEIPGKDGKPIVVPIGNDGTGTVPNNDLPDEDTPGTGRIKEPGKTTVEVKVETPKKIDPTAPETAELGTIEITIKPNGDAVVTPKKKTDKTTYPEGSRVKIPGENGTSIVVTIGKDGSGTVPNDQLPKEAKPGKGTVTEPGKKPSNPVDVTTPARKTPTVELNQDPNTGDVTVTPKKPDGTLYPENTKVEIPGKNGKPIVVIIGKDGKGTIPNKDLPDGIEPGKGTITEPGKDPVEVIVTTPARKIPTLDVYQDPNTGDVTVTPKKPDGSTYPPGTKVEIPGKNGTPIVVIIGQDGKATIPNSELPDGKVPGTGKITEPGQPAVEVPVETPAKVTPATPTDTNPVAPVTPDTPVKPSTDGDSGQDTPTPTSPTPNAVTPNADQVDTKTTVDKGAKSNDSQNVLPNTGTESNATLASLGLLGMLGGLGLALRKKKED
ncbi:MULTISPECIES: YSIRK-type signal peptide-containing protein [unclassified Streptococcus]|uniref:YSIRK-type signal peptide-containing protein n=2 Tax=unclassified Streptococcus TaxID=2608887 RepID=UPI001567ACA1|nr:MULTISPECIES: YSIRK-type signal peptide-containing protein [unclassified Streptococcus]